MNLTAWRDPTARVLRELWLALFTQDAVLITRCMRRLSRRFQVIRDWNSPHPLLRAATREAVCACAFGGFWLLLIGTLLLGDWP